MSAWQMYWLCRLDGIVEGTQICVVLSVIALIVCGLFWLMGKSMDEDFATHLILPIKISIIAAIIGGLGALFIPTTKQMAAIIVVPKIVNNEKAQEIPETLLDLYNEWTKAKLEEIKKGE